MKPFILIPLLMIFISSSSQAEKYDIESGKALVDKNCVACHGTELYTRSDRRVTSRSGLATQVQRCELALDLNWFDDDVENVAEHLNIQFYHFKK
ncbi:cytochrome c [Candidatus Vondammii sp. HM_W22]|uniref:cytochrome c n=1 Tax=Candidatus Vondammii sp. HM_W22 TaxID=2687299 RepID=UPI002E7AF3C2|nr:cytochrome c [Candidatus Vondammii sp. HM_W22]